jgi:hypothetical protein
MVVRSALPQKLRPVLKAPTPRFGRNRSMSTQNATHETSTDPTRFVATAAPSPMTEEKLAAAQEPDTLDAGPDERAVYAIAHQQGVVQRPEQQHEYEAMCVLYVTRDGERACERWIAAAPEEFCAVDRAFVADVDDLEDVGERSAKYAPIARKHEEVA